MAIVLVAHSGAFGASPSTSAQDTTGANLLVMNTSGFMAGLTISDNKGNTWTGLTAYGTNAMAKLWYVLNPIVGTGHIFSFAGSGVYVAMQVLAFSGVGAFHQQTGFGGGISATGESPGAITPPVANTLFVTSYEKENHSGGVYTVGGGFIGMEQYVFSSGSNFGGAIGYKTSSATENPFWTNTVTVAGRDGAAMATFTPGGSSTGRVQAFVS